MCIQHYLASMSYSPLCRFVLNNNNNNRVSKGAHQEVQLSDIQQSKQRAVKKAKQYVAQKQAVEMAKRFEQQALSPNK